MVVVSRIGKSFETFAKPKVLKGGCVTDEVYEQARCNERRVFDLTTPNLVDISMESEHTGGACLVAEDEELTVGDFGASPLVWLVLDAGELGDVRAKDRRGE
jgi:hypothetical protein